ncbi:MAG TPA: hypothetical protein VD735_00220 [Candidatus Saccharimonadales bacterium]|nr:hypothetical protein [Candidatus Saccharimonadales bacterium]
MGMMDGIKDKMSDMSDEMRERYEQLKSQERAGELDDKARDELNSMRDRFEHKGE